MKFLNVKIKPPIWCSTNHKRIAFYGGPDECPLCDAMKTIRSLEDGLDSINRRAILLHDDYTSSLDRLERIANIVDGMSI